MCRANCGEAHTGKRCFDLYCSLFGKKAKVDKFSILFYKNTSRGVQRKPRSVFQFLEMRKDSVYLGNFLIVSKNRTHDFQELKERILQRFEGWNHHFLF